MTKNNDTLPTDSGRRDFMRRAARVAIDAALLTTAAGAVATEIVALPPLQQYLSYIPDEYTDDTKCPSMKLPSEYGLNGIMAETLETSEKEKFLVWHSEPFDPKKKTLILFPGNFGHLGAMESGIDGGYVALFKKAQEEGYQIMGVNYVGYANIPGKPSEAAFFRGAEKTIDWLIEHHLQPSSMNITGMSLGTTIAAHAANYLSKKQGFTSNSQQHVKFLMIGGTINVDPNLVTVGGDNVKKWMGFKGITNVEHPDPAARLIGATLSSVWHDKLDTGKELKEMAASRHKDRIHGCYLRGENDPWTARIEVEEHQNATRGMGSFTAKEVPGQHFLAPEYILGAFEKMDQTIAPPQGVDTRSMPPTRL